MSLDLLALKYLVPRAGSDLLAARYQVATIMTKAPLWGVLAALSILFPLLSRESRRDSRAASRMLRQVLRWMTILLAPVVVVLVVFPRQILGAMFPGAYVDAAPVLVVSALGMGALALCLVLTRSLQATDRARAPGAYLVVSVALQAALLVALVPRHGAMGAAIATAVASGAGALLALGVSARAFQLRLDLRDVVALGTGLALLAAVIAALAPQGRMATLGAIAAGSLAYAGTIWMLGLVRKGEKRMVLRRLRASLAPEEPLAPPSEA